MRLALIDLDRTLISVNSASGWIRRELRMGFMSPKQALVGAWWIGGYQLGFARMESAIEQAVATLQGEQEAAIRDRTHAFWREEVAATIRPGARRAIAAHQAAGDKVILLTSSSTYMSEICAAELGLDGWLCNRFEVNEGLFTGRVHGQLCFGAGKVHHARQLAQELGVSLADAVFYTDSYSDLPGLEAVGEPVVVAPDPRLKREARKRGWRVESWD